MLRIVRNDSSESPWMECMLESSGTIQRISMDGVYAENRPERFQRISMDGVASSYM